MSVTLKSLEAVKAGVAHLRTYGEHEAADAIEALEAAFMRDVDEIRAFAIGTKPKETPDSVIVHGNDVVMKDGTHVPIESVLAQADSGSGESGAPESESATVPTAGDVPAAGADG